MSDTQWNGLPVPSNEGPGSVFLTWEVVPHPQADDVGCLLERSWQKMLACVTSGLESFLERADTERLKEGITITFRLVKATAQGLEELEEQE